MKKTLSLALLVVVAVFGTWYALLEKPAAARIKTARESVAAEEKKLAAYKDALSQFVERRQEYDTLHNALLEFGSSFSGTDEVIALYHLLDSLCHRPGYHLDEITPSLEEVIKFFREWESGEDVASIPIRIKIRGEYRPLSQLVETIEQSIYFDHLQSCRVVGGEELYPDCRLELAFIAGLYNRKGILDIE